MSEQIPAELADLTRQVEEAEDTHRGRAEGVPTPYGELADLIDALPLLVRERRRAYGLSLRAAAQQTGVGFNTLSRFEKGQDCSLTNAIALLRWLGKDAR